MIFNDGDETLEQKDVFHFLETLRASGITNMFGAAPYIEGHFECSRQEARYWLMEWIESY